MCLLCFPETMHVAGLIVISPSAFLMSSHVVFSSPIHARKAGQAAQTECESRVAHVIIIPSREFTSSRHVSAQRSFLLSRARRFSTLRALPGQWSVLPVIDWRSGERGEAARRRWAAVVVVTAGSKHRGPPKTLPLWPHSLIQPPHLYQHHTCHVTSRPAHYETTANARATTFRYTTPTSGFASA